MKLLLLPAYFYPELVSDTPLDEARYQAFADAKMKMALYTPTPTRNVIPVDKDKYRKIHSEILYNGMMHAYRFRMIDEGKNPVGRALRYFLCFFIQLYYGLKEKNVDVVFVISTPPIQGLLAALLKKWKGCKFVYNLQDIFPDTLVGAGLASKGGLLWKIGRLIENYTYRNADKIIVISQSFKNNLLQKGVPEEKIEVVYNWVDENAVHPVDKVDNPLFSEYGINADNFNVVYAGNLGNAQNLDIIICSAEKLRDKRDISFLVFGKGGVEDELRAKIQEKNLGNVRILPLQPYERVSYVYGVGDVCVVSCKAGFGGSALPSKTWSILSAGRPVLASFDEGELQEILENNNMGMFVRAENVDEFVDCILKMYSVPELCKQMGKNGRSFIINNLTRDAGVNKYVKIISDLSK